MDPNANLDEQLRMAKLLIELGENDVTSRVAASRLAELVVSLDEWIRKGGFLPSAWAECGVCGGHGGSCPYCDGER